MSFRAGARCGKVLGENRVNQPNPIGENVTESTPHPGTRPASAAPRARFATGNARPLLAEIRAALEKLLATGEPTVIDLHAIPFAPGDEHVLDEVLGHGEITATVTALGESRVEETDISGVWRVNHHGPDGAMLSRFVEVTFCPEILTTQRADAEEGLARLGVRLEVAGEM
jgi:hydrogenase-1 operon protein HyaF